MLSHLCRSRRIQGRARSSNLFSIDQQEPAKMVVLCRSYGLSRPQRPGESWPKDIAEAPVVSMLNKLFATGCSSWPSRIDCLRELKRIERGAAPPAPGDHASPSELA